MRSTLVHVTGRPNARKGPRGAEYVGVMAVMTPRDPLGRAVLRTVLIVVGVALSLYLLYLLRKPITWLVIAAFIAVAMSGPVNLLERWLHRRGPAIAIAYISLIMIPVGLGALLIPSLVNQIEDLAGNVPEYAQDVTEFVQDNETLSDLNEKYDFTSEIESAASDLPAKIGDAAGLLQDIGVGVVNSVFATVTILILSIFMVGVGPRYAAAFVRAQPAGQQERVARALGRIANAIGNYVGGALLQATIAGVAAFVVLTILGAPFAGPLALIVAFFDLIPVVGATIAAVLIGVIMLFVNFPVAVIIWTAWAIVYQQIENYVIQPQIQRRAVEIEPFIVLVSVLFGSTLFGILGAILAIPTAASLQIVWHEWREYRNETLITPDTGGPPPPPGAVPGEPGPAESPA
jgi:predicted PurR-regulated permease PerM